MPTADDLSCLECAVKHVGIAQIFLEEAQLRPPDDAQQRVLKAYDHLSHSSDIHLSERYKPLASKVRDFRKTLEPCAFYGVQPCPPEKTGHEIEQLRKELRLEMKGPCPTCLTDVSDNPTGNPGTGARFKMFASKKPLSGTNTNSFNLSEKMAQVKVVTAITGFSFAGKVLERGFVEVDKALNMQAQPPHSRPSTWLNVGVGVAGLVVGGMFLGTKDSPWDLALMTLGAHHLTKVVDYVEEYVPAGRVTPQFVRSGQVVPSPMMGGPTAIFRPSEIVA